MGIAVGVLFEAANVVVDDVDMCSTGFLERRWPEEREKSKFLLTLRRRSGGIGMPEIIGTESRRGDLDITALSSPPIRPRRLQRSLKNLNLFQSAGDRHSTPAQSKNPCNINAGSMAQPYSTPQVVLTLGVEAQSPYPVCRTLKAHSYQPLLQVGIKFTVIRNTFDRPLAYRTTKL
ncbi:hypothetical protein Leryth_007338 [Lithospermum erythrorhizon]|nr:hypothetical protein Leryth_007338 [Lithospermum erythrorhizon]